MESYGFWEACIEKAFCISGGLYAEIILAIFQENLSWTIEIHRFCKIYPYEKMCEIC